MAYMTNREFAEHLFKQEKKNEYADALVKEVRRLREEKLEREKGCACCSGDEPNKYAVKGIYAYWDTGINYCPMCGKSLKEETHD